MPRRCAYAPTRRAASGSSPRRVRSTARSAAGAPRSMRVVAVGRFDEDLGLRGRAASALPVSSDPRTERGFVHRQVAVEREALAVEARGHQRQHDRRRARQRDHPECRARARGARARRPGRRWPGSRPPKAGRCRGLRAAARGGRRWSQRLSGSRRCPATRSAADVRRPSGMHGPSSALRPGSARSSGPARRAAAGRAISGSCSPSGVGIR